MLCLITETEDELNTLVMFARYEVGTEFQRLMKGTQEQELSANLLHHQNRR